MDKVFRNVPTFHIEDGESMAYVDRTDPTRIVFEFDCSSIDTETAGRLIDWLTEALPSETAAEPDVLHECSCGCRWYGPEVPDTNCPQCNPEETVAEHVCLHPIEEYIHHGFVSGKQNDFRCTICNTVVNFSPSQLAAWDDFRAE